MRKPVPKEYHRWRNMKRRCYSQSFPSFKHYGGRGITVCEQWMKSFRQFLKDMGPCPDGFEIGRIDNDGNYEPSNCKWVTRSENENNKRTSRFVEFNGEKHTITEWSRIVNINTRTLFSRFDIGFQVEDALHAPIYSRH